MSAACPARLSHDTQTALWSGRADVADELERDFGDSGTTWQTVATFSTNAKLQFRCDASDNSDDYDDHGEAKLASLPEEFALSQNHPNPFNPTTSLTFDLPEESHVELAVFNVLRQKVPALANGRYPAGRHTVQSNARGNASDV